MNLLPAKRVRPLIAVMFSLAAIVGFFMRLIPGEAFFGLVTFVLTYIFKARDEAKAAYERNLIREHVKATQVKVIQ